MAAITDLRDGLKANLETVDGLRVLAYAPSELSTSPAAVVSFLGAEQVRQAMGAFGGGLIEWEFAVEVFVADNGDPGRAEERLDELLDSTSVPAAIETDPTLGSAADHAVVVGYGPYEWVSVNGQNARFVKGSVNVLVRAGG